MVGVHSPLGRPPSLLRWRQLIGTASTKHLAGHVQVVGDRLGRRLLPCLTVISAETRKTEEGSLAPVVAPSRVGGARHGTAQRECEIPCCRNARNPEPRTQQCEILRQACALRSGRRGDRGNRSPRPLHRRSWLDPPRPSPRCSVESIRADADPSATEGRAAGIRCGWRRCSSLRSSVACNMGITWSSRDCRVAMQSAATWTPPRLRPVGPVLGDVANQNGEYTARNGQQARGLQSDGEVGRFDWLARHGMVLQRFLGS